MVDKISPKGKYNYSEYARVFVQSGNMTEAAIAAGYIQNGTVDRSSIVGRELFQEEAVQGEIDKEVRRVVLLEHARVLPMAAKALSAYLSTVDLADPKRLKQQAELSAKILLDSKINLQKDVPVEQDVEKNLDDIASLLGEDKDLIALLASGKISGIEQEGAGTPPDAADESGDDLSAVQPAE